MMPYSEGALAPGAAERLRRHVASCARCGEEMSAIAAMARTLRQAEMPAMEPATDLWARVRSGLESRPEPRAVWTVRSFQAASAAAVAAVLLFFIVIRLPYQDIEPPTAAPSVKSERPAMNKSQPQPSPATKSRTAGRLRASESIRRIPHRDLAFEAPYPPKMPYYAPMPSMPAAPAYRQVEPKALDLTAAVPAPAPSTEAGADSDGTKVYSYAQPESSAPKKPAPVVGYASPAAPGPALRSAESVGGASSKPPALVAPQLKDNAAVAAEPGALKGGDGRFDAKLSGRIADEKQKRDLNELADRYDAELTKKPDDPRTLSRIAELDEKRGDKAAAIKHRKRLTEVCPKDPMRWVDLGRAYESNLQNAEAIAAYKQAISLGLTGNLEADVKQRIRKLTEGSKAPANSGR